MGGVIWIVIGVFLCIASIELRLGDLRNPGPGFMPFIAGVFFAVFGIILRLQASPKEIDKKGRSPIEKIRSAWNRKELVFTLLALLGYILLLTPLGFIFTTFLFLFFLFKTMEPKRWFLPLISSLSLTIFTYLIFTIWLKCQFPRGIFKGIIP